MIINNAKEIIEKELFKNNLISSHLILLLSGILILNNTGFCFAIPYAEINEIMYNPSGNDNNLEFVEIIYDNYQDMDGWTIGDLSSNDTLVLLQYKDSEYAIIVEEGYDYSSCNASVYSAGATIGNNLNNDLDSIFLYDYGNNLIAIAQYNNSIANDNGKSIEVYRNDSVKMMYESLVNGGTPCRKNSIIEYFESMIADETYTNSTIDNNDYTLNTTDYIDIITIETNSTINNTNITYINITETNSTETDSYNITELCNITIKIKTDKPLYNISDKVKIWLILNDGSAEYKIDYMIEYWIEDLFEDIIKPRYNTTNTNQKIWTAETVYPANIFIIKAKIAYLNCTDADKNDNFASAMIIVKGNKENAEDGYDNEETDSNEEDSRISIIDIIYPKESSAKFGEMIKVKIEVYKGNTGKTLVSAYVEDNEGKKASEITSLYLHDKYMAAELTIPIQLKPNCDGKLSFGSYTLVITGLDDEDSTNIKLSGISSALCKEKIIYEQNQKTIKDTENLISSDSTANTEKTTNLPAIKSFYTLVKKYSPDINLFAGIDYPAGFFVPANDSFDNLMITVILEGENFKENLSVNSMIEKLAFKVNISEKENLFTLKLIFKNKTVSEKDLIVDFSESNLNNENKTEETEKTSQNNLGAIIDAISSINVIPLNNSLLPIYTTTSSIITGYSVKAQQKEDEITNNGLIDENAEDKSIDEGKTIYESVSEKSKIIVIYIFTVVMILGIIMLVWKKMAIE
jgi:hypothetical protein